MNVGALATQPLPGLDCQGVAIDGVALVHGDALVFEKITVWIQQVVLIPVALFACHWFPFLLVRRQTLHSIVGRVWMRFHWMSEVRRNYTSVPAQYSLTERTASLKRSGNCSVLWRCQAGSRAQGTRGSRSAWD